MSIMDDAEGLQFGPKAFPLYFPSNLGVDVGLDDDASMPEAMDWTPWQSVDSGLCLPHQDSTFNFRTLPANADLGVLCNDDLIEFDISASPGGLGKSDTTATTAYIHPSETPFSTQHPLVEDLQMLEVLHSHSQLDSRSYAMSDSSDQVSTLPVPNRHPTTEDWEFYRPIFTRLYRDENRTLKDIKSIMRDIYGFNAT
jgi:hypothetical protein